MNRLLEAALTFQRFAESEGWPFAFMGALAVTVWGEPRATRDFDVCLFTDYGAEKPAVESILKRFEPRSPDAIPFALEYRVLRIFAPNGVPGDIALGALPFEAEMILRARKRAVAKGAELTIPTAEDLIVMKAFAGRERDWEDIKGILRRSGKALELDQIRSRLAPLLEALGKPEAMERLEQLIDRHLHRA